MKPLFFLYPSQVSALRRFFNGEVPHFSTGIDDRITAGYGRLDDHGFWQFDLPWFFIVQHGWHDGWRKMMDADQKAEDRN